MSYSVILLRDIKSKVFPTGARKGQILLYHEGSSYVEVPAGKETSIYMTIKLGKDAIPLTWVPVKINSSNKLRNDENKIF